MPARLLAGSVVVTWPALFAVEYLPQDGALNGKPDDLVTGAVVVLIVLGLLAAGWLKPPWVVAISVMLLGFTVPLLYGAVVSAGLATAGWWLSTCVLFAVIGLLLVGLGSLGRRASRNPAIDALPR